MICSAGYSFYVLTKDNLIYCCGHNGYGELGNGNKTNLNTLTKMNLPNNI